MQSLLRVLLRPFAIPAEEDYLMRLKAALALAIALTSAAPVGAESPNAAEKAALNAHVACANRAILALDDRVSDAATIAGAALLTCEREEAAIIRAFTAGLRSDQVAQVAASTRNTLVGLVTQAVLRQRRASR